MITINNNKASREVMCFMMDPTLGKTVRFSSCQVFSRVLPGFLQNHGSVCRGGDGILCRCKCKLYTACDSVNAGEVWHAEFDFNTEVLKNVLHIAAFRRQSAVVEALIVEPSTLVYLTNNAGEYISISPLLVSKQCRRDVIDSSNYMY
ncbi:uncharacterized protein LOC107026908 [Solanum pennellii]|uniref:Uncharacterized protein LOC107026908 n=1 Tax=Solanum pennellii TaxID=28526 RepID=A0ABM1VHL3_SOLPN|nr:uncharacterized protein LOC107026908 [Solanum pennellii]